MKKLMLLMPNYYGFDEVVIDVLKKYSGCEVFNLNYDVGFKYENFGQRLYNAFSKTILRKNLKPIFKEKYFYNLIKSSPDFDYLLVNRPDIIPAYILDEALAKSKDNKLLLWDSLHKIPISDGTISKFSQVYSFDEKDCMKYNFEKIDNFHFVDEQVQFQDKLVEHDAVFLGTVDNRINDLEILLNKLVNTGINAHAYLHVPRERSLKLKKHVTVLKKIVPFKYADSFSRKAPIIIDLAHANQIGLSFRFFEAMVLRNKVITTNINVRKYDFYNDNNIFIIDDINNFEVNKAFFETPYQELPANIVFKYSAESWVKTLIKN